MLYPLRISITLYYISRLGKCCVASLNDGTLNYFMCHIITFSTKIINFDRSYLNNTASGLAYTFGNLEISSSLTLTELKLFR